MDWLLEIDQDMFLLINGWYSEWADTLMYWISHKWAWIPVYLFVLLALWRRYGWRPTLGILVMVVPLIVFSDQLASGVLKPNVARARPCHEDGLLGMVHLVDGRCGGPYGFASSHAANFFALATYLGWFFAVRYRWLAFGLALLVAYSRVYLGVHYPGDVIVGALIGVSGGLLMRWIFLRFVAKRVQYPSSSGILRQGGRE